MIKFLLTLSLSALSLGVTPQDMELSREYQVKAVFLFNFSQFVEFPSEAFLTADSPLVIGVLGKDPFGDYLDETVNGEKVNGHSLTVERYKTLEEIKTCHILFISADKKLDVKGIFKQLENRPILTVGDMPNFAKNGGIIRFLTDDNKTRIRINIEAAKKANVTISSKLLRIAEIINSENN
jgi:hypothetical protein